MMELVDDDVVKGPSVEAVEVRHATEGLDRGKENVGRLVFLGTGIEAELRGRANPPEGLQGLAQDLLAVGHE